MKSSTLASITSAHLGRCEAASASLTSEKIVPWLSHKRWVKAGPCGAVGVLCAG